MDYNKLHPNRGFIMTTKTVSRFATPTRLTAATKILGATAKQWDEALTGDMVNSLKIVKARVQALKHTGVTGKVDVQQISSGDLASAIKHRKIRVAGWKGTDDLNATNTQANKRGMPRFLMMMTTTLPLQNSPYVVVFAGPNGSGKTSLIDEVKKTGLAALGGTFPIPAYFINPDQVAKDLVGDFATQDEHDRAAFHAAFAMRLAAIKNRQTFAFETVMSHSSRINELVKLKEQGYHVLLVFITTDDPEKNISRVTLRYQTKTTTGHFVAPEKVRERYHRTLALLPKAVEIADAAFVYDNSIDFEKASLQALIDPETFSVEDHAKPWVSQKLVARLQSREQQLFKISFDDDNPVPPDDADVLNGQYTGRIIQITEDYIVQTDSTSGRMIIHDRLMLDTSAEAPHNYRVNDELRIIYSVENAPEIVITSWMLKNTWLTPWRVLIVVFKMTAECWQLEVIEAMLDDGASEIWQAV